uniref:Predicted gene 9 n=2 Tax=Peromyscus maniculatus bairdii TaxID=230844 RepID=A0A8C8TRZ9_PERMB
MDRPLNFEDEDSGYQSLGVGAYLEEAKEAKPPEINVGAGGDGGDQIWPKPDLEVAAGEGSTLGFVDVGAGAPGTKTDEENKGYGVQDQDQPALEAAAGMPQLEDDANLHMICSAFSRLQLSELERIFQRTQFPDVFVRKELEIPVNVEANAEPCEPEDEVSKSLS